MVPSWKCTATSRGFPVQPCTLSLVNQFGQISVISSVSPVTSNSTRSCLLVSITPQRFSSSSWISFCSYTGTTLLLLEWGQNIWRISGRKCCLGSASWNPWRKKKTLRIFHAWPHDIFFWPWFVFITTWYVMCPLWCMLRHQHILYLNHVVVVFFRKV